MSVPSLSKFWQFSINVYVTFMVRVTAMRDTNSLHCIMLSYLTCTTEYSIQLSVYC